jgi:hypothetical protein
LKESKFITLANGDHWVTSAASIGREVAVYDSRFKSGELSLSLTYQLASLYRSLVILEEDGVEVDHHLVVYAPPCNSATEPGSQGLL